MDAIELLTEDHDRVRDLFERFHGGGGIIGAVRRAGGLIPAPERRATVEQICKELDLHTMLEEEVFYPAVRTLHDDDLNGMVDDALEEHATVTQRLSELRAVNGDEDDLDTRMSRLQHDVEHHACVEEIELFPRLEALMPERELAELGSRLAGMKRTMFAAAGAAAGRRQRRASARRPRIARGARAR